MSLLSLTDLSVVHDLLPRASILKLRSHDAITFLLLRFPCGRWLGKGVGDGSLERVLIGQLVSPGAEEEAGRWTGTPPELASPSQSMRMVLGSLAGRGSTF